MDSYSRPGKNLAMERLQQDNLQGLCRDVEEKQRSKRLKTMPLSDEEIRMNQNYLKSVKDQTDLISSSFDFHLP
jgi:hypothetical protein